MYDDIIPSLQKEFNWEHISVQINSNYFVIWFNKDKWGSDFFIKVEHRIQDNRWIMDHGNSTSVFPDKEKLFEVVKKLVEKRKIKIIKEKLS